MLTFGNTFDRKVSKSGICSIASERMPPALLRLAQNTMPGELKSHINSISEKNRRYMKDFAQVNAEARGHQDGGQFRNIDSPQNVTVPTTFMQDVHRTQNERKQTMAQKRTEVKQDREGIKSRKKETDEDIRRLYDSLVSEFQEMRAVSS